MRTKCLLIPKPLTQAEYNKIIESQKKDGWIPSSETEEIKAYLNVTYYLFTFKKEENDISTT